MKKSITSESLSGTLRQKMKTAADAGYEGFEICHGDLISSELEAEVLRRLADELGLEIVALQPLRDFEGADEDNMPQTVRRAEHAIELAARLGAKILVLQSNVSKECSADAELCREHLSALAEIGRKQGVTIGYEAVPWAQHVTTLQQAWQLVRETGNDNLGLVISSFSIAVTGSDMDVIQNIPGSSIVLARVADAPDLDVGIPYLRRHYRCFPGQGTQPVVEFAKALASTGYDDYCSNDVLNDNFASSSAKSVAREGIRSLDWLFGAINSDSAGQEEPQIIDFAFVEFAVEDDRETELLDVLKDIGFRQTHQHRSMNVQLFQLGGANIVLNFERDSYAEAYFWEHGLAVCAVGFSASNHRQLGQRAQRLGYDWVDSKDPDGELEISGVRGPGSVLCSFVGAEPSGPPFQEVFFDRIDSDDSLPGGEILRIDHIGVSVRFSQFLPSTLFFRSMLGLEIETTIELLDPAGIVQSRVAQTPSRKVRMPLTTSSGFWASPRHFIDSSHDAGVQQIALASSDIFATARRAKKEHILPIGSNYYEDLAARFNLADELLESLREYNILYDEDECGVLYHFYFRELFEGVFFEVLQRIDGYDRYGESNAIIRLAAQARDREAMKGS